MNYNLYCMQHVVHALIEKSPYLYVSRSLYIIWTMRASDIINDARVASAQHPPSVLEGLACGSYIGAPSIAQCTCSDYIEHLHVYYRQSGIFSPHTFIVV